MNNLTFPILRLLADGQFHSGEAIARHFNVTRATVWNALRDADSLGIQLFSVRGRGYRLPRPLQLVDAEGVRQAMGEHAGRFVLEVHDQLESTNSHLMRLAAGDAGSGTCVVAHLQTAGRGRRGRAWHAGLGNSLTFSLLWRFDCGVAVLSGLSLAVGVALRRALAELGAAQAVLKWPNDVLLAQKKLAGILIELHGDMEGPSSAVIGVGINLNLCDALRSRIDQPPAALYDVLPRTVTHDAVLAAMLRHLGEVLDAFAQHGFNGLREEWAAAHGFHGQPVRMHMPDGSICEGTVSGVSETGALLLETPQGTQHFAAGEISLRAAT